MKIKRKRYDGVDISCFVCLTIFALLIIVPFWNAVVISLETYSAYIRNPMAWVPGEFTWDNFEYLLKQSNGLIVAYANTIKVAVIGTLSGMLISIMAAYAFSQEFPGKKPLFYLMLLTMFFGGGLIPTYLLVKNLGLIDKHAAIILLSLTSTYNIIVMKNGFESIPRDLPEAAMIDGANELTIFARIMIPLQKPMIATFSLFTIVGYWNSWYWPMLVLNDSRKTVLQIFLRSLIASASQNVSMESAAMEEFQTYTLGIQMAAVIAVILPIMMVYPFLQKYFVKGVLVGGVKM